MRNRGFLQIFHSHQFFKWGCHCNYHDHRGCGKQLGLLLKSKLEVPWYFWALHLFQGFWILLKKDLPSWEFIGFSMRKGHSSIVPGFVGKQWGLLFKQLMVVLFLPRSPPCHYEECHRCPVTTHKILKDHFLILCLKFFIKLYFLCEWRRCYSYS